MRAETENKINRYEQEIKTLTKDNKDLKKNKYDFNNTI